MNVPQFDDLQVGAEIPPLIKGPVTRVQIVKYAGASGDFNPLHVDEEYATTKAGFKSVIAHGMLSMAFLGQFLTDWVGDSRLLRNINVQFRGNVFPGDTITCRGSIREKKDIEGAVGLVECEIAAENQRGETVTLGTALVALPVRAPAATS